MARNYFQAWLTPDVKSESCIGSLSTFSMFQEYNIIKQTGTTVSKFPDVKSAKSIILDIDWNQQNSIRLVWTKGSNLERKRSFSGGALTT